MATIRPSIPHEDRTAAEPRENKLESVIISHIHEVNETIRQIRLKSAEPNHMIKFTPGQWLDTYLPGLSKAGGFTITSTPDEAVTTKDSSAYLELAVQKSRNPPAQWLWQPKDVILGTQLNVRVGGSFTWPPTLLETSNVDRLVLIAGGVGINPLISIFTHLMRSLERPREVHFIYATKAHSGLDIERILFLPRLMDLVTHAGDRNISLNLFLTNTDHDIGPVKNRSGITRIYNRRIREADLVLALDGFDEISDRTANHRSGTVCYVCGPSTMTDDIVAFLQQQTGMTSERVLCERWW